MTEDKNKNFDELLAQLYSNEQAEQAKNDIESGDKLFASFAAPTPSERLINDIKAGIDAKLTRRPSMVYYKIAAVAAVILIGLAGFRIFSPNDNTAEVNHVAYTEEAAELIWNTEDFSENNVDLAVLSAEIEQVEMSISALRLDEIDSETSWIADSIDDLETQLIEIETIFWKG